MNEVHRGSDLVDIDEEADERGAALPLAGWLVVVALVYGTVAQGAFHRGPFRLVLLLLALAALVHWRTRARTGWGPAPALGAIAVGAVGVSVLATDAGLRAALPTLALLGGVVVTIAIASSLRDGAAIRLADGVLACGLLASLTAWAGVALHHEPWGLVVQGIWRGSSTLTYANATAALAGVAFLLAVARLGPTAHRFAVLPAYGLGVGVLCAGSRAGWLAIVLGLVVLARATGWGRTFRSLVPVGAGCLVAGVGLLPSVSASAPARPALAILGLVLGGLVALGLTGERSRRLRPGLLLLVGGAVLVSIVAGRAAATEVRETRLDLRSEDRAAEWAAAVDEFGSAPVVGVGPGQLDLSWEGADGVTYVAEYVHNEYLELLATFGLVGVAAVVAGGVVVIRHRRGARSPLDDGLLAALTVLAVHSGFDFLWHVPVLALVGGVLIGLVARSPAAAEPLLAPTPESESVP